MRTFWFGAKKIPIVDPNEKKKIKNKKLVLINFFLKLVVLLKDADIKNQFPRLPFTGKPRALRKFWWRIETKENVKIRGHGY